MFKKDKHGKWEYDYDLIVAKTNQKFAQEVREIFYIEQNYIHLVDVQESATYVNIVILTTGLCHELLFQNKKEQYVNYISASAIERINKIRAKQ